MSFTAALTAASVGLQIFGSIQKGRQEQQALNFNAQISQQRATLIRQAGDIQIDRLRKRKRFFSAKQQAAFAGAGVRLTGSPLQVLSDTAAELELDILVEDFNTRVGVLNAQTDVALTQLKASQARTSSAISTGTTLLSQLSSFVGSGNKGNIITTRANNPVSGPLRQSGAF